MIHEEFGSQKHYELLGRGIRRFMDKGQLSSECTFLDVGAYVGWWAEAAIKTNYFKEIHAIEPVSRDELNKLKTQGVHVHYCALGERNETVSFFQSILNPRNSSLYESHVRRKGSQSYTQISVESKTLDSFNISGDCFIKIDTEEHELQVLRGAEKTLTENNCVVLMEVTVSPKEIFSLMESYGYKACGYMFAEVMYPLPSSNVEFHINQSGHLVWTCDNLVLDYAKLFGQCWPLKEIRSPGYDFTKENPMWSDFIFTKEK